MEGIIANFQLQQGQLIRHAKTATDPSFLYGLKKKALEKMLEEGKAIGLHYSRNLKLSQQHSVVLIASGEYLFHLPPKKEDFQNLPHLGYLNNEFRNPKITNLSLKKAKALLVAYTGLKVPKPTNPYFLQYINRNNIIITKRYDER